MRIWIGNSNRITLPKQLVENNNIQVNKFYDIDITKDKIVIDLSKCYDDNETTLNLDTNEKIIVPKNMKIVSNIEEGEHFSNKVYSPCRLVIRTKRKYVNKFCDVCKGYLYNEHKLTNNSCPYISNECSCSDEYLSDETDNKTIHTQTSDSVDKTPDCNHSSHSTDVNHINISSTDINLNITNRSNDIKDVINSVSTIKNITEEIKSNIQKVSNNIDKKVDTLDKPSMFTSTVTKPSNHKDVSTVSKPRHKSNLKIRNGSTTLQYTNLFDFKSCSNCKEFVDSGFLIDNKFYCKRCAKQDFIEYMSLLSSLRKE